MNRPVGICDFADMCGIMILEQTCWRKDDVMLLARKNAIRGLSKKQYSMLLEMCRHANSLANVAEWHIRHYHEKTGSYLSYEKNCRISKHNPNYKMLQAQTAQQTLKRQDKKHQSFFGLLRAKAAGTYSGPVNPPHYRKKGGYDTVYISGKYIIGRGECMAVPMSRTFRKKHGGEEILIPIPPDVRGKKIHEVQIIPERDGSFLDAVFVYEAPDVPAEQLDKDNILSLDPGLDNFVTGACTDGTTFIIDGRKIKSINQGYNKQKAQRQSNLPEGRHWSRFLTRITRKREDRLRDFMHKAANEVVRQARAHDCGTVIIGTNKGQKQNICLGTIVNQNFVQIPHARFRSILADKCARAGIHFIEQEESYTSKASALDGDFIPTWQNKYAVNYVFAGKRIKRGLYRSANGMIINADVNGALNIARKSKQNGRLPKTARLCRGVLDTPARLGMT